MNPTYGTCVNFVPVQDPSQEISYKFEEVSSTTDIKNKLDISASGSMKMAILKATAHLSFLADEKFRLDTKKFFLRATVTNSALFTAPSVSFKKGATVLGTDEIDADYIAENRNGAIEIPEPGDQFNVSKCGHGFVSAIISYGKNTRRNSCGFGGVLSSGQSPFLRIFNDCFREAASLIVTNGRLAIYQTKCAMQRPKSAF